MSILLTPILKIIFEFALLYIVLSQGIRELSSVAIICISLRLIVSLIHRFVRIPYMLDEYDIIIYSVGICIAKIVLETSIFYIVHEDLSISIYVAIGIVLCMLFRNVSDTWSLLSIDLEE